MQTFEIFFIAFALSIDAFAVAIAAAATGRISDSRSGVRLAFHFGLFQFLMPMLGWAAGATLEPFIAPFDHWVAFILLTFVGVRMLRSSRRTDGDTNPSDPTRGIALVVLSIAVSIDALAVGLTLALLRIEVWTPSIIIGAVTAFVSLLGIFLGVKLHSRLGRLAELLGGVILILIAVRIVVSHMNLS